MIKVNTDASMSTDHRLVLTVYAQRPLTQDESLRIMNWLRKNPIVRTVVMEEQQTLRAGGRAFDKGDPRKRRAEKGTQ